MKIERYLDADTRLLNPLVREIEPEAGDRGWGAFGEIVGKGVDEARRGVHAVLSSGAIDRYGEIIRPNAFADFLPGFMRNAVFLADHNHETQIGSWQDMKIDKLGFHGWAIFANDPVLTRAAEHWALYRDGHRKAFSVGFIGHEWEMTKRDTPKGELRVREWTVVEPVEGSSVAVPANPDALVNALLRRCTPKDEPTTKLIKDAIKECLSPEPGGELHLLIEAIAEQMLRSHGGRIEEDDGDSEADEDGQKILKQLERMTIGAKR